MMEVFIQIIWVSNVLEGQPKQLRARIADDLAEVVVDSQKPPVRREVCYTSGGRFEDGPESLFALALSLLRPLPLGQVEQDALPEPWASLLVLRQHRLVTDPHYSAVLGQEALLNL